MPWLIGFISGSSALSRLPELNQAEGSNLKSCRSDEWFRV